MTLGELAVSVILVVGFSLIGALIIVLRQIRKALAEMNESLAFLKREVAPVVRDVREVTGRAAALVEAAQERFHYVGRSMQRVKSFLWGDTEQERSTSNGT